MQKTNFNKKFCILLVSVVLMSLLAVTTLAAVTYEDGTLSGLLPGTEYQYTYVTLENYNASLEQIDVSGNEFTTITADKYGRNDTVTDAGIIYLVNDAADVSFVWIEGDGLSRSDIGKRNDNGTLAAQGVDMGGAYDWTEGTWVMYTYGKSLHQPSANYISNGAGGYFGRTYCTAIFENPDDAELQAKAKTDIESIKYKYAYQPSEIIPVEELQTFSYNTGLREGSLNARSASGQAILTKVVLYTLNETGMITRHTWTEPTTYFTGNGGNIASNAKTTHTISIPASFPDAAGYVMGIEVYPYAVLPDDVKFTVNGYWHTKEQGSLYTSYLFEYIPDGYTTVYKHYETKIPAQYNGANTAYIEGYANGTFKPEANITKAEAATIISRLIFGEKELPVGYVSAFEDVTANAWYYNTIAYLEAQGVFDYIEGSELEPNAVLTRGELAQMVSAFIELPVDDAENTFPDVTESTKYADAIITLASAGIVKGDNEGNFNPEGNITRAEAVTLFNRLVNLTVNDDTVVASTLENTFSDIANEWYTNNILVAANDNVQTKYHINASSALADNGDNIVITTGKFSVKINKENAKIEEIVTNSTNFVSTSLAPFFATLTSNSGLVFVPKSADVVDGRLQIVFGNGIEAYFIVEAHDNFFTVQLDSELPFGVSSVKFASLSVNADTEEYRLSALPMDTRVANSYNPGGASKATAGVVSGTIDSVLGAKIGVTFASYADDAHRAALKAITDAIDITKGIKSNAGGAYVLDDKSGLAFKDTVIVRDTTLNKVNEYITTAPFYSVDVLQVHQLSNTFRQGDFDFSNSLGTNASALIQQYGNSAKAYKAEVSDKVHNAGLKLNFHTYSAGMKDGAFVKLLAENADYLDQIYYNPAKYTLAADIDAAASTVQISEGTADINYPNQDGKLTTGSDYAAVPYSTMFTAYFRIDDEIVQIKWNKGAETAIKDETTINVSRGQLGTTAVAHSKDAEIKQILGLHQCIQPVAGSKLFYEVAKRTAQAYNEADFDMIYLDGQDSIIRFVEDQENLDYYLAEFVRVILENIELEEGEKHPIIEGSAFSTSNMWAAGAKYGAVDSAVRGIKTHKINHINNYCKNNIDYYYTSTLGWFDFGTDSADEYKNVLKHTVFRDDLDYMGSLAIAYDIGMTYGTIPTTTTLTGKTAVNVNYYGVYSRLRKAGYFSEAVKETIRNGEYEYRLVEENGAYAFQEMYYDKNRVYDSAYATGSATNPFPAATPFIRIEQNYTAGTADATPLVDVGDAEIQVAKADYTTLGHSNISDKMALKVNVTGNGENGAILISLYSTTSPSSTSPHADYLIRTSHTGSKEFSLVETDNGNYNGFSFDGIGTGIANWGTHGATIDMSNVKLVRVRVAGNVEGVKMGDICVAPIVSTSATNPTITINGNTIKFVTPSDIFTGVDVKVNSGDYVEYYPETNKAYLHYYTNGTYAAKELTVEGSVTAPQGDFTYTYNATGSVKAKVVIGMQGAKVANEVNPSLPNMGAATLAIPVAE